MAGGADAIVEGFRSLSTGEVSDALDRLRIPGTTPGLVALDTGYRTVGRAFTVLYQPKSVEDVTVGDYIDDVAAGEVVVIDNAGRLDCTVWGDILTMVAHSRDLAGTVINGVCRDTADAREIGYPIFSRGRHMRTGKDRVGFAGSGVGVDLGGVRVLPGDVIVGDDDGIVVVPQSVEAEVLELARAIAEGERRIIEGVRGGASLAEARAEHGYHVLQRAES